MKTVSSIKDYFGNSSQVESSSNVGEFQPSTSAPRSSISNLQSSQLAMNECSRTELIFLLASLKSGLSSRAAESLMKLMPQMFSDSKVAAEISLARTKYAYTLCFGVAPYFEQMLVCKLKKSPEFVVMFDESLNKVAMKCQMDILVRFWDADEKVIVMQYLTSVFLGRSGAQHLLNGFCSALQCIGLRNLLAVAMDGPNVNWSFLSLLGNTRQSENFPELLDVGSCGIHVVHGAFIFRHRKCGWKLYEVLSNGYNLF